MDKNITGVDAARSQKYVLYPAATVRTPHGAWYVPPDEDIPGDIVEAIERAAAVQQQRPRRRGRCAEDPETCGRHSGIPPCCRAWWHRVWRVHARAVLSTASGLVARPLGVHPLPRLPAMRRAGACAAVSDAVSR